MNYAHIAHDCQLGRGVIMANSATLAGHITVGDGTVMAGVCVFHQFVRIGRMCMVSGMTGSRMDLPPFVILDGLAACYTRAKSDRHEDGTNLRRTTSTQ